MLVLFLKWNVTHPLRVQGVEGSFHIQVERDFCCCLRGAQVCPHLRCKIASRIHSFLIQPSRQCHGERTVQAELDCDCVSSIRFRASKRPHMDLSPSQSQSCPHSISRLAIAARRSLLAKGYTLESICIATAALYSTNPDICPPDGAPCVVRLHGRSIPFDVALVPQSDDAMCAVQQHQELFRVLRMLLVALSAVEYGMFIVLETVVSIGQKSSSSHTTRPGYPKKSRSGLTLSILGNPKICWTNFTRHLSSLEHLTASSSPLPSPVISPFKPEYRAMLCGSNDSHLNSTSCSPKQQRSPFLKARAFDSQEVQATSQIATLLNLDKMFPDSQRIECTPEKLTATSVSASQNVGTDMHLSDEDDFLSRPGVNAAREGNTRCSSQATFVKRSQTESSVDRPEVHGTGETPHLMSINQRTNDGEITEAAPLLSDKQPADDHVRVLDQFDRDNMSFKSSSSQQQSDSPSADRLCGKPDQCEGGKAELRSDENNFQSSLDLQSGLESGAESSCSGQDVDLGFVDARSRTDKSRKSVSVGRQDVSRVKAETSGRKTRQLRSIPNRQRPISKKAGNSRAI